MEADGVDTLRQKRIDEMFSSLIRDLAASAAPKPAYILVTSHQVREEIAALELVLEQAKDGHSSGPTQDDEEEVDDSSEASLRREIRALAAEREQNRRNDATREVLQQLEARVMQEKLHFERQLLASK